MLSLIATHPLPDSDGAHAPRVLLTEDDWRTVQDLAHADRLPDPGKILKGDARLPGRHRPLSEEERRVVKALGRTRPAVVMWACSDGDWIEAVALCHAWGHGSEASWLMDHPANKSRQAAADAALVTAVECTDMPLLDWALSFGASPNQNTTAAADAPNEPLLHALMIEGEDETTVAMVDKLLRAGADPLRPDRHGHPFLHEVCLELATMRCLLAHHNTPEVLNATDSSGATALHQAAQSCGVQDGMLFLLAAGADPTIRDHAGRTPRDILVQQLAIMNGGTNAAMKAEAATELAQWDRALLEHAAASGASAPPRARRL